MYLLRTMRQDIQNAQYFTIMADESADTANEEQLAICLRGADDDFETHEGFIGLNPLPNTKADRIVKIIFHVIYQMGLSTENTRGQCYDGAATISGTKHGIATQIKSLNKKVLYAHCNGHSLSLSVNDYIRKVDVLKNELVMIKEVCILVKK